MWLGVIWCGLVILFAWFGNGTGPKRVFKALGYATATLVVPAALILGGIWGYATYKDAERERIYAAQAPERAAKYAECVAKSEKASASAKANMLAGHKPKIGLTPVTDVEVLRTLNGCPSNRPPE